MRNKAILSILGISLVVLFIVMGIFLGRSDSKMQDLFDKTITALDNEEGLKELFNDYAVKESKTLDEDIKALNDFYKGKNTEIKKLKVFHESSNVYRMHATVTTDKGKYFICIGATGSRLVDNYGISQLIIEDSKEFQNKKIFKKDEFSKYVSHANAYGVTIRKKGDMK